MLNVFKIKISLVIKFNKYIVLCTLFLCCENINSLYSLYPYNANCRLIVNNC